MATWTDDFERSSIGPTAPNGTPYTQQPPGRWSISSGAAFANTNNDVFLLADLGQSDIEVSMVHRYVAGLPQGVVVRYAGGNQGYVSATVGYDGAGSAEWVLESVVSGSNVRTPWGRYRYKGYLAGRNTRLVADGHSYYVYVDDILRIHYTDVAELHPDTATVHGLYFTQDSDGGAESLTYSTDITPPPSALNLVPGHKDAPVGCAELPVGDLSTHLVGLATELGEGLADETNALLVEEEQS
jgi:hypothetical protein